MARPSTRQAGLTKKLASEILSQLALLLQQAATGTTPAATITPGKKKSRRGRPPKNAEPVAATAPKRRGRPPRNAEPVAVVAPKRRGRPAKAEVKKGRPRKAAPVAVKPKRRGRPRKADAPAIAAAPKRAGRPRKVVAAAAPKKAPGRPKKVGPKKAGAKKSPGRPKKTIAKKATVRVRTKGKSEAAPPVQSSAGNPVAPENTPA